MPDQPQNHEDDGEFEDEESLEFELDLSADDEVGSDSDVRLIRGAGDEDHRASTPNDSGEEDVAFTPNEFDGLQFVDLSEITIPQAVLELVPESVARENIVLPFAQENAILKIIVSDPSDIDLLQKLQFILKKEIQPLLAPREQIVEAINRHYGQSETESVDSMLQEFTDAAIDFNEAEATQSRPAVDDSDPFVKLANLIIVEAIWLRAGAIHIEPLADRIRVRYRMDGLLVERDSLPRRLLDPLLSHIKIMSNIAMPERPQPQDGRFKRLLAPLLSRIKKSNVDMSARSRPERSQPQDGRMKMNIEGGHFDLRVRILPTDLGEAAVIRILDRRNVQIGIGDLGFQQDDHDRFQQIIKRPGGMFLVTGPPGSGTTTTLYVALNHLNRPDRKIITAEDPVEYSVPGINQVEVKEQIGLDYAGVIREILRQGPDIIAIGEIRDRDTAQMAVQASLAGHLVLSTLRSPSDAASAITRLVDLGVQPFLIASSVTAVMAQRLVRVLCPKCKEPDEPDPGEIRAAGMVDKLAKTTFMRGRGCNHCNHTGYRGRTAIFELLSMSAAVREMTFKQAPTQEIRRQARLLGMHTLLEDGVNKAARGITSLEEVLGACRHELQTDATDSSEQ